MIAAGGGGSGDCNDAGSPKEGDPGHCETREEGGGATGQEFSSGGAGFITNSDNNETKSFINGGIGGQYKYSTYNEISYGSFGGGGNSNDAGGGGGGYKGGDSGTGATRGFGGYSFNSGIKFYCISGYNSGAGFAKIIYIKNYVMNTVCPVSRTNSLHLVLMA